MTTALAAYPDIADSDAFLRGLIDDLTEGLDPATAADRIGFTPDAWQRRILETPKTQTIILCSRQSGKSTSSAFKAIHKAMTVPDAPILIISPGERQSGLTLKKAKQFYRDMGEPVAKTKWNDYSIEFANGSGIYALPGSEDTVRGFSAIAMLLIDEASRVRDALYQAVRPMVAVSGGEVILMSTPWGKRGFFYDEWLNAETDDDWERIGPITADMIPRISAEFLAKEQRSLPEQVYQQEYFCRFLDEIGAVFTLEQIERAMSDATVQPSGLFALPGIGPLSDPAVQPRAVF